MPFELAIVNGRTVAELIETRRSDCIEVVRRAYLAHEAGQTVNPDSCFLRYPGHPGNRIIALPAHLGADFGVSGLKWIGSFPGNVARGFPRASAVLVLNDPKTGYPYALLEASILSASRTAASAALAAHWLNKGVHRARALGFVGTGLIARYVYRFLLNDGWTIDEVLLHDLEPHESARFATEVCVPGLHRRVQPVRDLTELLRSCDLIVIATVAPAPHIRDAALFQHHPLVLHLSLRDLTPEVVLAAHNVVDDVEHVLKAGTSVHLTEQRVGHRRFIDGTLAQVMLERCSVERDQTIIFSPFGLGMLDVAVGQWVYRRAAASGRVLRLVDFFHEVMR